MAFVASGGTAALIGGGLAAAGSIYSADKAADAQKDAAKDANAVELKMFNQTREDQAPWRDAGTLALSELLYGLGLGDSDSQALEENFENFNWQAYNAANPDVAKKWRGNYDNPADRAWEHYTLYGKNEGRAYTPTSTATQEAANRTHTGNFGSLNKTFSLSDFQRDPGYQFRLDEGLRGIQSSAAGRGALQSGATLKALTRYNQDFASGEYDKAYDRFNNDQTTRFNRLATVAGVGQTANNVLSSANQAYGNSSANNRMAEGNASSAGYIAAGNGINSAIGNATSYYTLKDLFSRKEAA